MRSLEQLYAQLERAIKLRTALEAIAWEAAHAGTAQELARIAQDALKADDERED